MTVARVGWLGGSFDPVHEGHLHVARGVADALTLSRVLLVPASHPPHKPDRELAPGPDRLALLEIACRDDARLQPSDVELRRGGLSYSYDTACELARAHPPGTELLFILGADMLVDLPSWHRVRELAELVTFCPVARPGTPLQLDDLERTLGRPAADRTRRHVVTLPLHPASSTAVREALTSGAEPQWLPPGVAEEIVRRGLYGRGGASSRDSSGNARS